MFPMVLTLFYLEAACLYMYIYYFPLMYILIIQFVISSIYSIYYRQYTIVSRLFWVTVEGKQYPKASPYLGMIVSTVTQNSRETIVLLPNTY